MMNVKYEIRPGQSTELLKELHILTRDGKMNQDTRRKLKQIYHLYQFIEPLLQEAQREHPDIQLVDHGAGKSYLGFILYDLFFKTLNNQSPLSQEALAARLELDGWRISRGTLSKIEAGIRQVTDFEVMALARTLKVPPEWLMDKQLFERLAKKPRG